MSHFNNTARGFFALMSVTIVSLTLLFAAVSLSVHERVGNSAILLYEGKIESALTARSCANIALTRVVNDSSFSVTTPITYAIGRDECIVESVTPEQPTAQTTRIRVRATSGHSQTILERIVDSETGELVSEKELAQ